jgi:hypothetical protein
MVAYFSSKFSKQYRALFSSALLLICLLGTQWIGLDHSITHSNQQQASIQKLAADHQSLSFNHSSDTCHLFDALTLAGFIPSQAFNIDSRSVLGFPLAQFNHSLIAQFRTSSYLSRAPPTFII